MQIQARGLMRSGTDEHGDFNVMNVICSVKSSESGSDDVGDFHKS